MPGGGPDSRLPRCDRGPRTARKRAHPGYRQPSHRMNVLLVGSGAREHAIAWKLRQSPALTDLFVAPGNAGTAVPGTNLPLNAADLEGLARAARENHCQLVVVGPEEPLARGLVDRLAVEGIAAFGPSRAAARIESSKAFAKDLMQRHGIPTARPPVFSNRTDARNYVEALSAAPVVKADGLTAGKGAIVCDTRAQALQAIESMMGEEAAFGEAGRAVVIEERLGGGGDRLRHEGASAAGDRVDDGGGGSVRGGRPDGRHRGAAGGARGLRPRL